MTTISTTSVQPTEVIEDAGPVENLTASQAPVLITEQEVVFGTAAAIPALPAKTAPRWIAALRHVFAKNAERERRVARHYPHRYTFLEASCMARAMDRL